MSGLPDPRKPRFVAALASSFGRTVVWEPQWGPQTALISCPVFEVFYGGARGGGKTESSIGDWIQHSNEYGNLAIGIFVRRVLKQLEEVIARTKTLFPKIGATYNEQRKEWTMAGGGRLKFVYLENDADAEEYQGHSYTRVYIEEATNFPFEAPIAKLRATLRSGGGVKCGMRLTGNPGGPGHGWVRARYIDPNPLGYEVITETIEWQGQSLSLDRVFIPSKLKDNALLLKNDPNYVMRLMQSGSKQLVKAWLDGDWDAIEGAFFSEFDPTKHVLDTHEWLPKIPRLALRFRAFDWGSRAPFSVGWYAMSNGTWGLPDGALVKYREWYGSEGPNKGLMYPADVVARGIVKREAGEKIRYGVADPSIFDRNGGPSIHERMNIEGCGWMRGDNKRIVGWDQLRARLRGIDTPDGEVGTPMLYFLDSCMDSIRTIPMLQFDSNRYEDVDSSGEDHAGDETRYAVMSRPWQPAEAKAPVPIQWPKPLDEIPITEYLRQKRKARLENASNGW